MPSTRFHPSVEEFLNALDLPSTHPHYFEEQSRQSDAVNEKEGTVNSLVHEKHGLLSLQTPLETNRESLYYVPPKQEDVCSSPTRLSNGSRFDSSRLYSKDDVTDRIKSALTTLITFKEEAGPALVASGHLFFRLFAPAILAVAAVAMLFTKKSKRCCESNDKRKRIGINLLTSFLVMLCSLVIATDTMYLLEYGKLQLVGFYVMMSAFVYDCCPSRRFAKKLVLFMTCCGVYIVLTAENLIFETEVIPGFYYDDTNQIVNAIAKLWPVENRLYSSTPWAMNGDTRTGIPYFLNRIPDQTYVRRWVPSSIDGAEAVILDIAFPNDGIHRKDKPLYFVLCGFSGGSQEGYVKDFVSRMRLKGSTVTVMVMRGLMDSPIMDSGLPHFARISDIEDSTGFLRQAAAPKQTLAGVGYSMGAILLGNYAAKSGKNCNLDAIVMISGALDTRVQLNYSRSERFWQPILVTSFRDMVMKKFMPQLRKRLSEKQIRKIAISRSIKVFDDQYSTLYHGFDSVVDYYGAMGGMGDVISLNGTFQEAGRIANVSVPLLALNAIDDPIGTIRTIGDPYLVSKSGNGNILLLITEKGGHVGWPIGQRLTSNAWCWMNNVASSFVDAADMVLHVQGLE